MRKFAVVADKLPVSENGFQINASLAAPVGDDTARILWPRYKNWQMLARYLVSLDQHDDRLVLWFDPAALAATRKITALHNCPVVEIGGTRYVVTLVSFFPRDGVIQAVARPECAAARGQSAGHVG